MMEEKAKSPAAYIGILLFWGVLGSIIASGGIQIWNDIDHSGWINHMEYTSITMEGNWLEGESKECSSPILNWSEAAAAGKDPGYALGPIRCDDGPSHHVKVQFYGRRYQPGATIATWQCTREMPSMFNSWAFTCKQIGRI